MGLSEQSHGDWQAADLADMMAHQLRASLVFDLGHTCEAQRQRIQRILLEDGANLVTFSDLLEHPNPPVELLNLAKDFAKSRYHHREGPLPPKIATLLYYACIAAARLRLDKRITELADEDIAAGLEWALKQSWVDRTTRRLFERCLEKLAVEN